MGCHPAGFSSHATEEPFTAHHTEDANLLGVPVKATLTLALARGPSTLRRFIMVQSFVVLADMAASSGSGWVSPGVDIQMGVGDREQRRCDPRLAAPPNKVSHDLIGLDAQPLFQVPIHR
jgi:hypothetical protein